MVKVLNDGTISVVNLAPFESFNIKNGLSYAPKPISAVE